jgi:hypothetical protein
MQCKNILVFKETLSEFFTQSFCVKTQYPKLKPLVNSIIVFSCYTLLTRVSKNAKLNEFKWVWKIKLVLMRFNGKKNEFFGKFYY